MRRSEKRTAQRCCKFRWHCRGALSLSNSPFSARASRWRSWMYHSSLSVVSKPHSSCVRPRMAASKRRAAAFPCPLGGFRSLASVVCRMSSCLQVMRVAIHKMLPTAGCAIIHWCNCKRTLQCGSGQFDHLPDRLNLRLRCIWQGRREHLPQLARLAAILHLYYRQCTFAIVRAANVAESASGK